MKAYDDKRGYVKHSILKEGNTVAVKRNNSKHEIKNTKKRLLDSY